MDKLHADKSPFAPSREIDKKAHWLKPTLVAEVRFSEWTHSGSIRHAVRDCARTRRPAPSCAKARAHQGGTGHAILRSFHESYQP
jgi:bifunctional non-homologous end joining protein LigD